MKLAEIQLDQATANYLEIEQNVILTSIEAYLNVLKSRRDVNLNESNLKRLQAHVNAALIRVEAGAATPTRLAEAEARHARAKSNALVAATDLQNAEDAYKSLTGLRPGDLTLPATPENLPEQIARLKKLAGSMHPHVRAALAAERAANQAFNTLKAGVSPTLSLSLSATSKDATGTSSDLGCAGRVFGFLDPYFVDERHPRQSPQHSGVSSTGKICARRGRARRSSCACRFSDAGNSKNQP